MSKGTFILYDIDLESIEFLTPLQVGELFIALSKYRLHDETPDFGDDRALKIIFHQAVGLHIVLHPFVYKLNDAVEVVFGVKINVNSALVAL